jgi:hypothetical protein
LVKQCVACFPSFFPALFLHHNVVGAWLGVGLNVRCGRIGRCGLLETSQCCWWVGAWLGVGLNVRCGRIARAVWSLGDIDMIDGPGSFWLHALLLAYVRAHVDLTAQVCVPCLVCHLDPCIAQAPPVAHPSCLAKRDTNTQPPQTCARTYTRAIQIRRQLRRGQEIGKRQVLVPRWLPL